MCICALMYSASLCVCDRLKTAERQYMDAFEDELSAFIERVKSRAKVRIEEATQKIEEVSEVARLCFGASWNNVK